MKQKGKYTPSCLVMLAFVWLNAIHCFGQEKQKIDGVNLVSTNTFLTKNDLISVQNLNAEWIAIIPYAFLPKLDDPNLMYDLSWQWIGETSEGVRTATRVADSLGFNVMVKPQIWVGHGEFTGQIEMNSEEDWRVLEKSYREYIVEFAALSQESGVELLCIGTELELFVKNRPDFWFNLIEEVRGFYSGKLIYAENWDCYSNVPFQAQLDYIGIDAYFPIAKGKQPSLKRLKKGWSDVTTGLKHYSDSVQRKIIFTEYGYCSSDRCAEQPWQIDSKRSENYKLQRDAFQALFVSVWNEPYFGGGFLWKWYPEHHKGRQDLFSVQGKIAEELLRNVYAN